MVHDGKLKFIWNGEIRNEIVGTINKIPGFPGEKFLRLFRKENEFKGKTFPEKYTLVSDPSDRKFIALAKEVKAILITNDDGYSKGLENVFIRTNSGLGCCDDACLIAIGRLHSPDALLLAWAIDAVDTYSKCTINSVEGGFDEWLGKELEKKWSEKYNEELVTKEETTEIIYLGAKRNDPAITFSSSHRRFNEMGLNQLYSTILNHYNFAKDGTRPPKYSLGFDQTSSKHFYKTMEERFELFGKGKLKKS